jgi:N utilization substance protein B
VGRRRRAREFALQVLFQLDLTEDAHEDVLEAFWDGRDVDADVRRFAESLRAGVCRGREELDRTIIASAENWRLERMAVVDRNVLRMAVYELLQKEPTPAAVVIDEAVEIARKFGSGDSSRFINGVLDSVRRRLENRNPRAATDVGADG